MAVGYRVALEDGVLSAGDGIFGAATGFNTDQTLGSGSWTWSGISADDGLYYTDVTDTGTYHLGSDGHIYFVPDTYQVSDLDAGEAATAPAHDARVYGTSGDDSLSGTSGDDVIHGGDTTTATATGNDTIFAGAGDDTVFGGSGSDSLQGGGGADSLSGGDGDDRLQGDNASTPATAREVFDWSAVGSAGTSFADGITQDTGTMRVTVNVTNDGNATGATISNSAQYVATDETFAPNSAGGLSGSGMGDTSTTTLVFDADAGAAPSDEVQDVSFRINDIDTNAWRDIVTVEAFDAAGNPVTVTLTAAGDDAVSGNTITAGPGDDRAYMANGSVLVNIAGPVHMIRIGFANGMSGSQVITLSNVHFTTLVPADGDDVLDGGAGDDTLIGDAGDDRLSGGDDDDRIEIGAGQGDDQVDGGSGQDTLAFTGATSGLAVTYGTSDTGTWTWGGGGGSFDSIEQVTGSSAADSINAGAATGPVTIDGGAGDDTITGGSGNDSITAGTGGDRIDAGAGNDTVALGADGTTDSLTFADGDGIDRILGFDAPVANGDGSFAPADLLDVSGLTDAAGNPVNTQDVTVSDDGAGNALLGFPNGERLILVGIAPAALASPAALEAMGIPSARDNVVEGTDWGDTIGTGYDGDPDGDRVDAADAADSSDNDLIYAYGGQDNIFAEAGDDTVYGGTEADNLIGGAGNDTLFGEAGNDGLTGGDGDDSLYGGDGDDALLGKAGNDLLIGGDGADDILGDEGDDTASGGIGDDFIDGGDGNDSLSGDAGDDIIGGGLGNDTLQGDDGDDRLDGGDNDDLVLGGEGADLIEGGRGNDTVDGGDGDDSVNGGEGDDSVTGGAGNDYVRASYGNDTLSGGEGDDYVWGGFGDDLHLVENRFGNDTYVGYDEGETNGDTLDFSGVTDDLRIDLRGYDPEWGSFTDGTYTATFEQMEHLVLGAGTDTLVLGNGGGGGADRVTGFAAPVQNLDGTWTGYDQLDVGGLLAADGKPVDVTDVVVGSDGAGNALLTFPGGEALVLVGISPSAIASPQALQAMGAPAGPDHIVSGTAGADVIDSTYAGDPEGDRVDAGDAADGSDNDVIAAGDGDDSVAAGAGADRVSGGDGDDTLRGGAGFDTLSGEAGADRILFGEGDSVDGGSGDDTFVVEDTGEAGAHEISLRGGDGYDTLDLRQAADMSTLTITGSDATGQTGTVQLRDGSVLSFKEIENIICFTPGARIATPLGARAVETLRVGDLVVTRDHGLQPVRWIGSRTVPASDRLAPVRLKAGALPGLDRDILVSPQHRFLFRGYRAEMLFGESEVLVAATHLVDGRFVTRAEGGTVTYLHLLFDQHEIIYAEGAATESFHPGEIGLSAVTAQARDEIFDLFPELRSMPARAGRTARTCLRRHEAALLRA